MDAFIISYRHVKWLINYKQVLNDLRFSFPFSNENLHHKTIFECSRDSQYLEVGFFFWQSFISFTLLNCYHVSWRWPKPQQCFRLIDIETFFIVIDQSLFYNIRLWDLFDSYCNIYSALLTEYIGIMIYHHCFCCLLCCLLCCFLSEKRFHFFYIHIYFRLCFPNSLCLIVWVVDNAFPVQFLHWHGRFYVLLLWSSLLLTFVRWYNLIQLVCHCLSARTSPQTYSRWWSSSSRWWSSPMWWTWGLC